MQTTIKNYSLSRRMNFDADFSSIREFRRRAKQQHKNGKAILDEFVETSVKIIRMKKKEHRLGKLSDSDKKFLENQQERCSNTVKEINRILQGSQYNASDVLTNGYPELLKTETRKAWLGVKEKTEEDKKKLSDENTSHVAETSDDAQLNPQLAASSKKSEHIENEPEKQEEKIEEKTENGSSVSDLFNDVQLNPEQTKLIKKAEIVETALAKQAEKPKEEIRDQSTTGEIKRWFTECGEWINNFWTEHSIMGMLSSIVSIGWEITRGLFTFSLIAKFVEVTGKAAECAEDLAQTARLTSTHRAQVKEMTWVKNAGPWFEKHGGGKLAKIFGPPLAGLCCRSAAWRNICKVFSTTFNVLLIVQVAAWIFECAGTAIWDFLSANRNSEEKFQDVIRQIKTALNKLHSKGRAFKYMDTDIKLSKGELSYESYMSANDWYPLAYYYDYDTNKDVQGVVILTISRPEIIKGTAEFTGRDKDGHKQDMGDIREVRIMLKPEKGESIEFMKMQGMTTSIFIKIIQRICTAKPGETVNLGNISEGPHHYFKMDIGREEIADHLYLLTVDSANLSKHIDKKVENTSVFNYLVQFSQQKFSNIWSMLIDMFVTAYHSIITAPERKYKTDEFVTTGHIDPIQGAIAAISPNSGLGVDFWQSWAPMADQVFGKNNWVSNKAKASTETFEDEFHRKTQLDAVDSLLVELKTIPNKEKDKVHDTIKQIITDKSNKTIVDISQQLGKLEEQVKQQRHKGVTPEFERKIFAELSDYMDKDNLVITENPEDEDKNET